MDGQRTPSESALWVRQLLAEAPAVLPTPWRTLIVYGLEQAASILETDPWQSGLDQQVLPVVMDLLRGGCQACWAMATEESYLALPQVWPAAARWHHDGLVAILAGWRRRLPAGVNLALPSLEANRVAPAPIQMAINAASQDHLNMLLSDYLYLPPAVALAALNAIPVGVWIRP